MNSPINKQPDLTRTIQASQQLQCTLSAPLIGTQSAVATSDSISHVPITKELNLTPSKDISHTEMDNLNRFYQESCSICTTSDNQTLDKSQDIIMDEMGVQEVTKDIDGDIEMQDESPQRQQLRRYASLTAKRLLEIRLRMDAKAKENNMDTTA